MKRERRYLPHAEIRVRRGGSNGEAPGIEGYAAVFNQLSEDLGYFREIIMPGAFKDCLATKPDVRALWNHDANHVLGRTKAKTLSLEEDSKGLKFDCSLPDTQMARNLVTSIERGDVDQCSFGFFVKKQKWSEELDENDEAMIVREIHAADVFDVSPVTFPAYPQTAVDVRALWPDGRPRALRVIPELLRGGQRPGDEDENENGCTCDCTDCRESDNCAGCTDVACMDSDCQEAGCPGQAQSPQANSVGFCGWDNSGHIRIWPAEQRGAVAFSKTPASDSGSWDGDAARGRLAKWASSDGSGDKDKMNWSKYARGFAYVDAGEKDNFGGYKLPHHDVKDGKLVSAWGGVRAAMSALLGGRGGTSIPEGDRKAVYNHLAKEYKVQGKEAPDFHALLAGDALRAWMEARLRLAAN